MSSAYRILCLTHDPATTLGDSDGDDWLEPGPAFAAIADRAHPLTAPHAGCDLLLGRYSYPLIEVACPPTPPDRIPAGHRGFHTGPQWVDAAWLRLLWHATQRPEAGKGLADAVREAGRLCWTPDRVHRLRYEIRAVDTDQTGSCCPACNQAAAERATATPAPAQPWEG